MKKIGVVLFGNKSLEVREFPNLEPGLNEVLIEVKAAGICGSDLHFTARVQMSWVCVMGKL